LIRLSQVGRAYGSGPGRVVALEDIDLEIAAGEFLAVAGPSGSGKTTLLNLIGAIDVPTAGQVWIGDLALSRASEGRLAALRRHQLGFVFQHFNLVPVLSARENVELPLLFRRDLTTAQRRERARRALERVGLGSLMERRPAALSGGERQRVAVARALAGEPDVVLADEPTANLDHETGAGVIALMHELNRERGTTFLYASHDPELIRLADRVVWLRDGRLLDSPR
jgi:putative ABC transport system ATP-binding protein